MFTVVANEDRSWIHSSFPKKHIRNDSDWFQRPLQMLPQCRQGQTGEHSLGSDRKSHVWQINTVWYRKLLNTFLISEDRGRRQQNEETAIPKNVQMGEVILTAVDMLLPISDFMSISPQLFLPFGRQGNARRSLQPWTFPCDVPIEKQLVEHCLTNHFTQIIRCKIFQILFDSHSCTTFLMPQTKQ